MITGQCRFAGNTHFGFDIFAGRTCCTALRFGKQFRCGRVRQHLTILMMISFIIPAYNEQDFIAATIEQLYRSAKAAGTPYEIIVVADGCTDATVETARTLGARVLEVELRHISAVRNAGAKVAKGDIFVFVDADTLIPEGTLAAALGAHAAGAIGGGARTIVYGALSWPARLLIRVMSRIFFWLRLTVGGFLWVDRGSFEAVGGFDERYFAAEDIVMCKALKKLGIFTVVSEPMMTSGRKFEHRSLWENLGTTLRLLMRGPKVFRRREGLEIWYNEQFARSPNARPLKGDD